MQQTIAEAFPELFHYTNITGLEGILRSQTIWATHPAFMNDTSELTIFREFLLGILQPVIAEGVDELVRISKKNQTLLDEHGGRDGAIKEVTEGVIKVAYISLLGNDERDPFIEPYIASFCKPIDEKTSNHGLLSQWRAYGLEGGYAIGFASSGLDKLMQEEVLKWKSTDLFGGDVIYSDAGDEAISAEFAQDIEQFKSGYRAWFASGMKDTLHLERTYQPIVKCACRIKHWGFREENEVRYIAIPPNSDVIQTARSQGIEVEERPKRHFLRGGLSVPCIHLFDGITQRPDKLLPITRIIVGPHRDRHDRKRAIEMLLKENRIDVPVSVSEIPYVGRH